MIIGNSSIMLWKNPSSSSLSTQHFFNELFIMVCFKCINLQQTTKQTNSQKNYDKMNNFVLFCFAKENITKTKLLTYKHKHKHYFVLFFWLFFVVSYSLIFCVYEKFYVKKRIPLIIGFVLCNLLRKSLEKKYLRK